MQLFIGILELSYHWDTMFTPQLLPVPQASPAAAAALRRALGTKHRARVEASSEAVRGWGKKWSCG